jgi:hypothetical protein
MLHRTILPVDKTKFGRKVEPYNFSAVYRTATIIRVLKGGK